MTQSLRGAKRRSNLIAKIASSCFALLAMIQVLVWAAEGSETLFAAAEALHKEARYDEAIAGFKRLIEEYPSDPLANESIYRIGQCSFEKRDHSSVIDIFSQFVREYPLNAKVAHAHYLLGQSYYALGEYGLALEMFKKSVELGPQSAFRSYASNGEGWSRFHSGLFQEAL